MDDEALMGEALDEARIGLDEDEVPIGCVLVKNGRVVGRGHNRKEGLSDPTAHAEILALRQAAQSLGSWRLCGVTLYVTAEPCLMCFGAALQARIARLVYGCPEPKFGAVSRLADEGRLQGANHTISVVGGVLEDRCAALLRQFFGDKRQLQASFVAQT